MADALTVRDLFPDGDTAAWLERAFPDTESGRELAGLLPKVARDALAKLLSDQVDKLLDMDVLELFVSAWLKHREFAALANKEGEGQLVELVEHAMSSVHEPKVEIMLDAKRVFVLPLKIVLELEFRGVQLMLRGGRVSEVRLGELEGKGKLEIAGQEVTKQALGEVTLPGVLRLDPGHPALVLRPRRSRPSAALTPSPGLFMNPPSCGSNSAVECNLAKVEVEGSNPFSRSTICRGVPVGWRRGASRPKSLQDGR